MGSRADWDHAVGDIYPSILLGIHVFIPYLRIVQKKPLFTWNRTGRPVPGRVNKEGSKGIFNSNTFISPFRL